jgi:hypothetical protein
LQTVIENLRREGASVEAGMRAARAPLEARVRAYLSGLSAPRSSAFEGKQVFSGEAYHAYRQSLAASALDGEGRALQALSALLVESGAAPLPKELLEQTATAEFASLTARVRYLRTWLAQLLSALPEPEGLGSRADADRAFDLLVKSRFPMLVTKEGELVRLDTALRRLATEAGERGDAVAQLASTVLALGEDFMGFSKRLLDVRAKK